MSAHLFQFDFTLPLVLFIFLGFAQLMKRWFFDPIQHVKVARSERVLEINQAVDAETKTVFEMQAQLKAEALKTQQQVQTLYQQMVQVGLQASKAKLQARKEELAAELRHFKEHEHHRLEAFRVALKDDQDVLVSEITRKLLNEGPYGR